MCFYQILFIMFSLALVLLYAQSTEGKDYHLDSVRERKCYHSFITPLDTNYVIREVTPGIQNRLIFGNGSRVMTRGLTFTGEYTPVCDDVLIYIEVL